MTTVLSQWDVSIIGDYYKYDPILLKAFEDTVADIIKTEIAARQTGRIILGRVRASRGVAEIYPRYKSGLNADRVAGGRHSVDLSPTHVSKAAS